MTEDMTTTAENPQLDENIHFLTKVRTNLETFGRHWASAGLYAGKSALETGADNLRSAADYLGELAARFETEEGEAAPAEAEAQAVAGEDGEAAEPAAEAAAESAAAAG